MIFMKYTIRGFRNNKLTSLSGEITTSRKPNKNVARDVVKAVRHDGLTNCFICILTCDDGTKRIYEGNSLKVDY